MRTALAAGAALIAATPAAAQQGTRPGPWHDHMMGWPGPFGGLLGLVLVAALVAGAVVLLRYALDRGRGGAGGESQPPSARDLLDRRYAAGEIDREEYLRRKQDLSG
jgi:putative membrane protein